MQFISNVLCVAGKLPAGEPEIVSDCSIHVILLTDIVENDRLGVPNATKV